MHNTETELARLFDQATPARKYDARALPPYPGHDVVACVAVPRMPRLTGDLDADARLLLRAYKSACLHRYGKRPRTDKQAVFRMKAAVLAMRRHNVVSPYAWANFRLTQWQYSERRSKPPKIDYVFSASVVDTHAGMYSAAASTYDVLHRVEITPAHAELVGLWEQARRALAKPITGESGQTHALRMVQSILPPERYHALVELAARQRQDAEADLYRRIASGDWVW